MEKQVKPLKDIIEFGIESLDDNQKIDVPVKDFIYVYRMAEELRRFFHNADHYRNIDDVRDFLGDYKDKGMFDILNEVYLRKLGEHLDQELEEKLESEEMYCPYIPSYYKKK